MTSSNGNIFRVTGPLCREFTGPGEFPTQKGQWRGALMFSLICVWINGWVNNREAGDLRRHRGHYDVIVMKQLHLNTTLEDFISYHRCCDALIDACVSNVKFPIRTNLCFDQYVPMHMWCDLMHVEHIKIIQLYISNCNSVHLNRCEQDKRYTSGQYSSYTLHEIPKLQFITSRHLNMHRFTTLCKK